MKKILTRHVVTNLTLFLINYDDYDDDDDDGNDDEKKKPKIRCEIKSIRNKSK